MTRLECRSCGHAFDDGAGWNGAYLAWCMQCHHHFAVRVSDDADTSAPDELLDDEPEACLVCGGRIARIGTPPCDQCGGEGRPVS
jgi:hypothetical protein